MENIKEDVEIINEELAAKDLESLEIYPDVKFDKKIYKKLKKREEEEKNEQ